MFSVHREKISEHFKFGTYSTFFKKFSQNKKKKELLSLVVGL